MENKIILIAIMTIFFVILAFCKISSFKHHGIIRRDIYNMNLQKIKPILFTLMILAAIVATVDMINVISLTLPEIVGK